MTSKNARVAFDGRLWDHPGIGRYLRELFFAMQSEKRGVSFRLLLPEKQEREITGRFADLEIQRSYSSLYSLAEQWELFTFSKRVDLLHVPHFNIPWCAAKRW